MGNKHFTVLTEARGRRSRLATAMLVTAAAAVLLAPISANAATQVHAFSGDAYGTKVNVGSIVKSGPTSLVSLGCTSEVGITKQNTVATVDALPLAKAGVVNTKAETLETSTGVATRTTAETAGVNLLAGLIRADLVRAVSTTSRDSNGFHTSAEGSTFANLVVGLTSISATPAPNTTISLAGVGKVVLNEQLRKVGGKSASLTVNMIHVYVTITNDLLGIKAGTEIVVSHARSALGGPAVALLDGFAYGSKANVADLVISGPQAFVGMPCLGTNGKVKTNVIAGINVPGIINSGTVKSTAQGTATSTEASGETTSTVESLNLLNGLVKATVVKADAHASSDGNTSQFSDAGSTFLSLSVAGHPQISANVAKNTKVELAGIGTLYLHRVIKKSTSIEVRMIELVITDGGNPLGLALGSNIRVAVAKASVHV